MTPLTAPQENQIPEGIYIGELVSVADGEQGPFGVPLEWNIALCDRDGEPIRDGTGAIVTIRELTTQKMTYGSWGQSKAVEYLVAFLGDSARHMQLDEIKAKLPGSRAVVVLRRNEAGWPQIVEIRHLTTDDRE